MSNCASRYWLTVGLRLLMLILHLAIIAGRRKDSNNIIIKHQTYCVRHHLDDGPRKDSPSSPSTHLSPSWSLYGLHSSLPTVCAVRQLWASGWVSDRAFERSLSQSLIRPGVRRADFATNHVCSRRLELPEETPRDNICARGVCILANKDRSREPGA